MDAEKAQRLCQRALMRRYKKETFAEALDEIANDRSLDSGVIKFILAHAIGNVPQKIRNSYEDGEGNVAGIGEITVNVVRTVHNKDVVINGDANNNSA